MKIGFWLRDLNIELTFVSSLQIKSKKYSARKCVASFLKRRKVVIGQETERVFMQKQRSEGVFEKGVMRNFAEFTRKHLHRNPFGVFL